MYEKGDFDIQESKVLDRFGNKILQADERYKIFLLILCFYTFLFIPLFG